MRTLKIGKLPDQELSKILEKYTNNQDSRVLLGPKLGEDAAIIDMTSQNNNCLAVCVDPIMVNITNAPYFAVAININDIVTRGAIPKWASANIFFPENSTLEDVDLFFNQLHSAIKPHNISIVTGHTEVTSLVKNPGIILTMFGEVQKDKIITTSGAQENDSIILTGGAGIEGTAILASDLYDSLKDKVDQTTIEKARQFIYTPGICIAPAAYLAWKYQPHSLHDPTEGGIRKGIEEMALASEKGVYIYYEKIPIRPETKEICQATKDDPLAIFGSGALLISLPKDRAAQLLEEYQKHNILAKEIGKITKKHRILFQEGKEIPLEASYTDGLIDRLN
ncbi:MAG: AIR synthase family protein [Nanoarchaeota archaeon]|nr:AIR synthase family protein [Nanoarchaeota archaeon]